MGFRAWGLGFGVVGGGGGGGPPPTHPNPDPSIEFRASWVGG